MSIDKILISYQEKNNLTNREMVKIFFPHAKDDDEIEALIRTYQNWKKGMIPNSQNLLLILDGFRNVGAKDEADYFEKYISTKNEHKKKLKSERNKRYRMKEKQSKMVYVDIFGRPHDKKWADELSEKQRITGYPPFMTELERMELDNLYPSQEEFDAITKEDKSSPFYSQYYERNKDYFKAGTTFWSGYAIHYYEKSYGMQETGKNILEAPMGVFVGLFNIWCKKDITENEDYFGDNPLSVICRITTFLSQEGSDDLVAGVYRKRYFGENAEIHNYDDELEYYCADPILSFGKGHLSGRYYSFIKNMCDVKVTYLEKKEAKPKPIFSIGNFALYRRTPEKKNDEFYEVKAYPYTENVIRMRNWIEENAEKNIWFETLIGGCDVLELE